VLNGEITDSASSEKLANSNLLDEPIKLYK
jgi:hypothetical protein